MARLNVITPSVAMAKCMSCGAHISSAHEFHRALWLHLGIAAHRRDEQLWFQVYVTPCVSSIELEQVSISARRLVGHVKIHRDGRILEENVKYEVRSSYTHEDLIVAVG